MGSIGCSPRLRADGRSCRRCGDSAVVDGLDGVDPGFDSFGDLHRAVHVNPCGGIGLCCLEGFAGLPLDVVDDCASVGAGVEVAGDEARQVAHHLLAGGDGFAA